MEVSTRSRSVERLVDIITELYTHGVVNRRALMEKFNITERTVYRDLSALSSIVEICGEGQYRLILPRQPSVNVASHHSLAKLLNADNFFPERDDEFWQKLENRVIENHILVQANNPEHSVKTDLRRYLNLIEKAIQRSNICQIVYNNKTRIVHPYKLTNQKNIWYLNATENGKLKSFALSKINWLETKKERFIVDTNMIALINHHQDPWVSEETFEVLLRVKHSIAFYFQRRDLLPQQELLTEDEHGLTLRCQATHQNQIIPLILFWLPNITVLEPAWLKTTIVNTLRDYLDSNEPSITAPENG
ncbi:MULTISPECIES: YafY family protein [unclassified Serratia (in: enterobacteria)]|uniref:helix-turn-helix transcriptional regulator n=1 Tax=unclassified Serratia (in: enterobacteria) TaxID=2647522 RepID=UPI000507B5CD|nr:MULTISPECIES: WYL domain-containing protein [unclassified Serratia (in: enterobacteria)]KFK96613.1 DeoR faimly transcriptional regulator [Serratia sp. Ag2]KFK99767.1 DeoR faimly transcriptional regulator [Serratia sp. Ag1]